MVMLDIVQETRMSQGLSIQVGFVPVEVGFPLHREILKPRRAAWYGSDDWDLAYRMSVSVHWQGNGSQTSSASDHVVFAADILSEPRLSSSSLGIPGSAATRDDGGRVGNCNVMISTSHPNTRSICGKLKQIFQVIYERRLLEEVLLRQGVELLRRLGVPLIVDDLYALDSESLALLQPLHALIFLFKWIPESASDISSASSGVPDPEFPGFFAHQVVNNACATLAVLNALGNIPSLASGPELAELNSFTTGMDPQTRGLVITSADWLREAHNALSPPNAISLDELGLPKKSEDAYHFVVYLPFMGSVYELDGLKQYPVNHGPYAEAGEGWLQGARLLALRDDPLPALQAQLTQLQSAGLDSEAAEIVARLANENSKRERWALTAAQPYWPCLRSHPCVSQGRHVGKGERRSQASDEDSAREAAGGRRGHGRGLVSPGEPCIIRRPCAFLVKPDHRHNSNYVHNECSELRSRCSQFVPPILVGFSPVLSQPGVAPSPFRDVKDDTARLAELPCAPSMFGRAAASSRLAAAMPIYLGMEVQASLTGNWYTAPQFLIKFLVAARVPHSLRRSSLLIASGEQCISLDDRRTYPGLYASTWTQVVSQAYPRTNRFRCPGRFRSPSQGCSDALRRQCTIDPFVSRSARAQGGAVTTTTSSRTHTPSEIQRIRLKVTLGVGSIHP
ncbi:Ubiquitin carboxyl-terminal hydrolase [Salix suchowensis]|nr:Ubiquitin carboxyl-terminal hydrolase [Salix suchowensis]